MHRTLGKYAEWIYAVLRIVIGVLFACHGMQKLFGAFGGHVNLDDPMILAAGILELAGGGLVAIGLWTGYAAFISSGQMAVGYFMYHAPNGYWPIVNHGEAAVFYSFVFLYIATRGPGRFSVEALLRRRSSKK